MTVRTLILGCAAGALLTSPVRAQAPAPPPQAETMTTAYQMQGQFQASRRLITALVDRMPAEDFGFKPTPEMRTFAGGVAHLIATSFAYCGNLTGQPNPHKGEDLEKTVTTKDVAVPLLKEAFDYCGQFAGKATAASLLETYQANAQGPDGKRSPIAVERAGLFANYLEHNNEMYGYLSVYLRLKGLVPPSSDSRAGRGKGPGR